MERLEAGEQAGHGLGLDGVEGFAAVVHVRRDQEKLQLEGSEFLIRSEESRVPCSSLIGLCLSALYRAWPLSSSKAENPFQGLKRNSYRGSPLLLVVTLVSSSGSFRPP